MRRSFPLLVCLVIFIVMIVPETNFSNAATISSISLVVSPPQGDATTNIIIQVNGTPVTGGYLSASNDFPLLTVYYDGYVRALNIAPKHWGNGYGDYSTYEATWTTNITIPNEPPYSSTGSHVITATVRAGDGTTATQTRTFQVLAPVTQVPQVSQPIAPTSQLSQLFEQIDPTWIAIGLLVVVLVIITIVLLRTRRQLSQYVNTEPSYGHRDTHPHNYHRHRTSGIGGFVNFFMIVICVLFLLVLFGANYLPVQLKELILRYPTYFQYSIYVGAVVCGLYPTVYLSARRVDRMNLRTDLSLWGLRIVAFGLFLLSLFMLFSIGIVSVYFLAELPSNLIAPVFVLFLQSLFFGLLLLSGFMAFKSRRRTGIIIFNG